MQVFLHDHVAAAGKCRILVADDRGLDHLLAARILGAVDEAEQVALVEVTKAVNLVDRRDRATEALHDPGRELEAEIHALGADMEQQIARGRDRVARPRPNLAEDMQLGRPRLSEHAVPGFGADPHHAGEAGLQVAKLHGAK
jgi:hypothetical protein